MMPPGLLLAVLAATQGGLQTGTVMGTVPGMGAGVHQAVVYLVATGPDSTRRVRDTVLVDQSDLTFRPGLILGQPGLSVEFRNSDPSLHNVFGFLRNGPEFDLGTFPGGTSRTWTFDEPGGHVVLCHIHPEMLAYVLILPTPYYSSTQSDGRYRIDGVPPGGYTMRVWNARGAVVHGTVQVTAGRVHRVNPEAAVARRPRG